MCELAAALTGHEPLALKLMRTDRGPVAFLTIAVGSEVDLADAHELAGRLEEEIRCSLPHVIDVVVRTEPVNNSSHG